MNKKECPVCNGKHTIKYGVRKGVQLYKCQDCGYQFHMKQIIRRYLTLNPKMHASRELKQLADRLHKADEADFKRDYQDWKEKWKDTIGHKSLHKDGKAHYTHQRLRAAMNSMNLSPLPLHLPAGGLQGDAKYEQQD